MTRLLTLRTTVFHAMAAAALALLVGVATAGSVHAQPPVCPPGQTCEIVVPPFAPVPPPPPEPSETPTAVPSTPVQPPADPAPAPTVAVPEPVPTESPEPTETPTHADTSATPTPATSTVSPSAESNWNKPIPKSAKPSHAAAVSVGSDGPGAGTLGLLGIMGGVLLVGFGGLAFALWSRNRLATH